MKSPKHILVIRLSALGDVAMTVPVLRVIAQTYPKVRLTVLSRPVFKPLFNGIPHLTFLEADVYGRHKGTGLITLANEARKLEIDAVADLHNVIRSKIITTCLKPRGIKVATIDKGRKEKKALVRKTNKRFTPLKTTHTRYADVFATLGLPVDMSTHVFPDKLPLAADLQALIGNEPCKCIGVAPFAAFEGKTYPLDLIKDVLEALDQKQKYRIFLFGGGAEETEQLRQLESEFSSVKNTSGMLPFDQELALISNLDVMVSMDSGNGHLAAMMGIPVITLWGVTHPFAGFAPFGQPKGNSLRADIAKFPLIPTSVYGNRYPPRYENAIASIPPGKVVEKILEILLSV